MGKVFLKPQAYETLRTFEDWNDLGFIIIAGEKSVGRNELGQPLFSQEQVEEDPLRDPGAHGDIYW